MNVSKRLAVEQVILGKYFPTFKVAADVARGTVASNSGTLYGVKLVLAGFPSRMPHAYITSPRLVAHDGRRLEAIASSSKLHVLGADDDGNPQVCHFRADLWTPDVTLYQVVMKIRLWLEAFEAHRATGQPLDRFLPHVAE